MVNYNDMSMQYTSNFNSCKNDNFHMKMCDSFLISAQNLDCGYSVCWGVEYPQSIF